MWKAKLVGIIGGVNKASADHEKSDITATMTSHKPHEMTDPHAGAHPDCSEHPLCQQALLKGKQHNKPVRDMTSTELKAALAHRGIDYAEAPTNATKVKLLAPFLARYYYMRMKSSRMQQILKRYAKRSAVPALLRLYSTTNRPETEIARLSGAHQVIYTAGDCGDEERSLQGKSLAAATAALEMAEAARGAVTEGNKADFMRNLLVARKRMDRVRKLTDAVCSKVTPPLAAKSDGDSSDDASDDSSDDDSEKAAPSLEALRKRRLLPLAIKMVWGYHPPPDRTAGELISAHNFSSPAFKRSLLFFAKCLGVRFLRMPRRSEENPLILPREPPEVIREAIHHISKFLEAVDFHMFEKLTGEEVFLVDKLVSVRSFCAATAEVEAEIPILGGTRPDIAKRIGLLAQGTDPISAAAAAQIVHREVAAAEKSRQSRLL
jgi:hypothetical protein